MKPFKNNITEEQLENCYKLIDYHMNPDNFGEHNKFDMNEYESECGTAHCFAGNMINAGILTKEEFDDKFWDIFNHKWDGIIYIKLGICDRIEWKWCFAPTWMWDNNPQNAAKRMKYLLEVGLPENWQKIRHQNAPYPFD